MTARLVAACVLAGLLGGCVNTTNAVWPCQTGTCDWKPINMGQHQ